MNFIRRKFLFFLSLTLSVFSFGISVSAIQTHKPNEEKSAALKTAATIKKVPKSKSTNAVYTGNASVVKPVRPRTSNLTRVGVDPVQSKSLSLNKAIRLALQNNNDIEVARNDVKIAESTLRSLLGFYEPVFTVNPKYTNTVRPQPSTLGGADLSGVTRSNVFRVDSTFNRPVKQGGGNLNVFFNNDRSSTSSSFSQFNPTFNTSVGVSFTQPLLRNRNVDQTRRQIRIQRKVIAQSDADFRTQTINVISQVQKAYWDLVFALRDQQNRIANLNLTKENLRQVDARITAGAAAPLQRAEVSTELANRESDVLLATQQVSISENTLKRLLLKETKSPEWTKSFIPTDKPIYSDDPIDLAVVTRDAISNRPELKRLKLQNDVNSIDIKYFRNQIKPRVDVTTSYTMLGLSGATSSPTQPLTVPLIAGNPQTNANAFLLNELLQINPNITVPNRTIPVSVPSQFIGGYGKSLTNLFKNKTRVFEVGVTISLPLRNKTAKADLATAEFQNKGLLPKLEIRSKQL